MKYLILLFISTCLSANIYSIQLYTSKGINHARNFLLDTKRKKSFLYKTDGGYYTIRIGLFSTIKQALKYTKQNSLKDFSIVATDKNKIRNKKRKENIKQYLTPCRPLFQCNKNKKHPWELSRDLIVKNTKVIFPKRLIDEIKLSHQDANKSNIFNPYRLLRFYTDVNLAHLLGQKPIVQKRLSAQNINLKFGLQYYYLFHPNWHFYTDDRLILSYQKRGNGNKKSRINLDIRELYIKSDKLFENQANILLGREYFNDYRGWLFKNSLDMIRVFNKRDLWLYEFLFATRFTNLNIFNNIDQYQNLKNIKIFYAKIDYQYSYLQHIKPFFMFEKRYKIEEKNIWYGLSLYGDYYLDNSNIIRYWADISLNNRQNSILHKSNNAVALDIGAIYKPDASKYSFGFGYAEGANKFNQPITARNKSNYFNNNTTFKYYGEFLDPKLSNLSIASLYGFYDITPYKTITAALHHYHRVKNDNIFLTSYTLPIPNNNKKSVGNEIDILYNYLEPNSDHLQFTFGYFLGSSLFDNITTQKDGYIVRINYRHYW